MVYINHIHADVVFRAWNDVLRQFLGDQWGSSSSGGGGHGFIRGCPRGDPPLHGAAHLADSSTGGQQLRGDGETLPPRQQPRPPSQPITATEPQ